jgi:hypothetical protein
MGSVDLGSSDINQSDDMFFSKPISRQQTGQPSIVDVALSQDQWVDIPQLPVANQAHRCQGPWNHMVPFLLNTCDQWDQSFYLPEGQDQVPKQQTHATASESSLRTTQARVNSPAHKSYSGKEASPTGNRSQLQAKLPDLATKAGEGVWREVNPRGDINYPDMNNGARRKQGYRTGPLETNKARRAALVRKIGSCWWCWLSKVPVGHSCSVDPISSNNFSARKEKFVNDALPFKNPPRPYGGFVIDSAYLITQIFSSLVSL